MQTARGNGSHGGQNDVQDSAQSKDRAHKILGLLGCAVGSVLLWGTDAFAQAPVPQSTQQPGATSTSLSGPAPTSPAPQDAHMFGPQLCDSFMSPGTLIPESIAPTFYSYTLTLAGDIRDVALFRTSGNSDLDKAALACASAGHGMVLTVAGRPAEISWIGLVAWNRPGHELFPIASPDGPQNCSVVYYPEIAVRLHHQGTTRVRFHIAVDGSVKDLLVFQSSGYNELDAASLQCIAARKYFPPKQNGQPVELDQETEISWGLHR